MHSNVVVATVVVVTFIFLLTQSEPHMTFVHPTRVDGSAQWRTVAHAKIPGEAPPCPVVLLHCFSKGPLQVAPQPENMRILANRKPQKSPSAVCPRYDNIENCSTKRRTSVPQ